MPLVELGTVKAHLRVDSDVEDALIGAYRDAAEGVITEYLGRAVEPVGTVLPEPDAEGYDEHTMIVVPAIVAAILLLTGDLYENRESTPGQSAATLSMSVRALLAPWRVWRLMDEPDLCVETYYAGI